MKRLKLCALFAAVLTAMLLLTVSSYANSAPWANPVVDGEYTALQLDEPVTTTISDAKTVLTYTFTPSETGSYVFSSENTENSHYNGEDSDEFGADTQGRLLGYSVDNGFEELKENDDGSEGYHFQIFHKLKAGTKYYLQVRLYSSYSEDNEFQVVVTKNPVAAIKYTPVQQYSVREFTNCKFENGKYYYATPGVTVGDELTVVKTNSETITYTYKSEEDDYGFYSGDELLPGHIDYPYQFAGEPGECYYEVSYMGADSDVKAEVLPYNIRSIAFSPDKDYEIIENTEGEYRKDSNNEQYFHYNLPEYNEDDILKVTDTDGNTITYKYRYSYDYYDERINAFYEYDENEDEYGSTYISSSVIATSSNQESDHWTLQGPNKFTLSLKNAETDALVKIMPNPINSIEFVRGDGSDKYSFVENDAAYGEWVYEYDKEHEEYDYSKQYFSYYVNFVEGDKLLVTYKGQTEPVSYIYKPSYYDYDDDYHEAMFVNTDDNDDYISESKVKLETGQEDDHWDIGNHTVLISYLGNVTSITATVSESDVDSISFRPYAESGYTYLQNTSGDYDYDEDYNEYFRYEPPYFQDGDSLTVKLKSGEESTYIYDYDSECFRNDSGQIYGVIIEEDQFFNHWLPNQENFISISYRGATTRVPVTIIESDGSGFIEPDPEKAVLINPDETKEVNIDVPLDTATFKFVAEADGMYMFEGSDKYTDDDYDTVGRVVVFDESEGKYKQIAEDDDSGSGDHFSFKFQAEAGKTYYLQARFYSRSRTGSFNVTLTGSEINSMRFEAVDERTCEENVDGRWYEYEDEEYFRYYRPAYKAGDKIIVVKKGNVEIEYIYDESKRAFVNSESEDTIPSSSISSTSTQNNPHWGLGKHSFTLKYNGFEMEYPVTVVASTITGIEFVPITPIVYDLNDYENGWYDDEDEVFYYYTSISDGDRLIVKRGDTSKEYVFDSDNDSFKAEDGTTISEEKYKIINTQYDEPWTPGSGNYFIIQYAGQEAKVFVTINQTEDQRLEAALAAANKLLDTIDELKQSDYTESTWAAMILAKEALSEAINAEIKDPADIETKTEALSDKVKALKTPADEARDNAVSAAQELLNSDEIKNIVANKDAYSTESYNAFAAAKSILESRIQSGSGKTAEQIYDAINELNKAKSELKSSAQAEAEAREEAVNNANTLLNSDGIKKAAANQNTYTESTFKAFSDAKSALEAALKDNTKTSTDINNAIAVLTEAYGKLKTKADEAAEKEAAAKEAAVAEANTLLASDDVKNAEAAQADYSENSYKTFADAKVALDTALKDATKTSADINKLIEALRNALKGLKTKAQEAAAKAIAIDNADTAVAAAKKLTVSKYTTASATPFKAALKNLVNILAAPDAYNSDQINAAIDKLNTAKAALKLKKKNPMTAKAKKVTAKASVLKKRSKSFKKTQAFTIRKAKGTVTFKITKKAKKAGKKIVISKKGKVTLKKGLKKGKYVMKVRVTASGNGTYKKKVTYIKKFTVVVK